MMTMKILELASSRKLLTAGEPVTGLTSPAVQEIQREAAGRCVVYNQIQILFMNKKTWCQKSHEALRF